MTTTLVETRRTFDIDNDPCAQLDPIESLCERFENACNDGTIPGSAVGDFAWQVREVLDRARGIALEAMNSLVRAAAMRCGESMLHTRRVGMIATILATEMRLHPSVAGDLRYAASMHDVGMVGVPDGILHKPGKLTTEERKVMEQHTRLGAKILEGSSCGFMRMGAEIALTHHERWNGSGYPSGLKGEQIPIISRITTVADVFDVLTSKRPYKEPMTLEEAHAVIRMGSGIHFDPAVVDAFERSWSEIRQVRENLV